MTSTAIEDLPIVAADDTPEFDATVESVGDPRGDS